MNYSRLICGAGKPLLSLALIHGLLACGAGGPGGVNLNTQYSSDERDYRTNYVSTPISVSGRVVNLAGEPVAMAQLSFIDGAGVTSVSDGDGRFSLTNLDRRNRLLRIDAARYRSEFTVVNLLAPLGESSREIGDVILTDDRDQQLRFVFGGDVAFGRRYLDPLEITPRNEVPKDQPGALILSSSPQSGTQSVLQWIRPYYVDADWGVINFETPCTHRPDTPHPTKEFVFFTLPESLPALTWAGIDYVSLGNNHLFDYQEQGALDTLVNLDAIGIAHSGAGANSAEAMAVSRHLLKGNNYSFFSGTSITGNEHPVSYVATEVKGGAADLSRQDDIATVLNAERDAGVVNFAQLHGGVEYAFTPSTFMLSSMNHVLANGAQMVIAHHPHVAQGVGLIQNKIAVLGLGNLAFDQDRQETLLGLIARVDMVGGDTQQLRMLPVYLEDYRPRLISGNLADKFLRRIGELSTMGLLVYPYQGQGWVALNPADAVAVDSTVQITITIPESGSAVVDLRDLASSANSLLMVTAGTGVSMQLGRDQMLYGDFEDWDGDKDVQEAARWNLESESRYVCQSHAYRGNAALCLTRGVEHSGATIAAYRNRIRVVGDELDAPNKDLSLYGYVKAVNAGAISVDAEYYASFGELTFGGEQLYSHSGGSFDWQAFNVKLNMPADIAKAGAEKQGEFNARAVRVFLKQAPPSRGEGLVVFDDVAVINWEAKPALGSVIATPNPFEFIRLTGSPGQVTLNLSFRRHQPAGL